jgi:hypothetical protein
MSKNYAMITIDLFSFPKSTKHHSNLHSSVSVVSVREDFRDGRKAESRVVKMFNIIQYTYRRS